MAKITDILRSKPGFVSLGPASRQQILSAERALGLRFSGEYREYVSRFGAASLGSHEFTGVCSSPRLSVVEVTRAQRSLHPEIPTKLYVVEELNLDGAVAWQSESGEVYLSQPGTPPVRVAASLAEYLDESR